MAWHATTLRPALQHLNSTQQRDVHVCEERINGEERTRRKERGGTGRKGGKEEKEGKAGEMEEMGGNGKRKELEEGKVR